MSAFECTLKQHLVSYRMLWSGCWLVTIHIAMILTGQAQQWMGEWVVNHILCFSSTIYSPVFYFCQGNFTCNFLKYTLLITILFCNVLLMLPAQYAEQGLQNGRTSVRPSVSLIGSSNGSRQVCCWGSCKQETSNDSCRRTAGTLALNCKCGQRHVRSRWRRLNTDFFLLWPMCPLMDRARHKLTSSLWGT